jgi:hypothetical protein
MIPALIALLRGNMVYRRLDGSRQGGIWQATPRMTLSSDIWTMWRPHLMRYVLYSVGKRSGLLDEPLDVEFVPVY